MEKYFFKNASAEEWFSGSKDGWAYKLFIRKKGMQEKFGRKLQEKADYEFRF